MVYRWCSTGVLLKYTATIQLMRSGRRFLKVEVFSSSTSEALGTQANIHIPVYGLRGTQTFSVATSQIRSCNMLLRKL